MSLVMEWSTALIAVTYVIGELIDEWLNIGSAKGGTMEGPFVELVTHATSLIDVGAVGRCNGMMNDRAPGSHQWNWV